MSLRTAITASIAGAAAVVLLSFTTPTVTHAQGLQVQYGSKGVQTLSYGGVVLEDASRYPADAFHIWHMRSTDMSGNVISDGPYGWGESNDLESWNPQTLTETYTFRWGTIATQFQQNGDALDIVVTETNLSGSGIIFDGAEIYPVTLHFPNDPAGFYGYTQYAITTIQPGISVADYGAGRVTSVIPDESVSLYGGWKAQGTNTYSPLLTGTFPDGIATFLPHNNLPVAPGQSMSYRVSLRFTPSGVAADTSDAVHSFVAIYPSQLTWNDRRIIGTAYLSSSGPGTDITRADGFPTNPRRYFNDPTIDVTNPAGLAIFQARVLAQARSNALNAQAMNAQGVITWDLEGEQYPQSTSYVCSPDQIAAISPEMESLIQNPLSPYAGQHLDDAYFKIMSSAGIRTGVCIRPQVYTAGQNGTAAQSFLSANADIIANLEQKARYANARWGTTLFYVDSTVDQNGGTLDPGIFQQVNLDLPGLLFIPEESTPRYYAYTAPFYSFLFHTDLGTPSSITSVYPNAFGANLVNDVAAGTLAAHAGQLTDAVAGGDILMGHADYWQANDPQLIAIYASAGARTSSAPVQPVLSWNSPASIAFRTALSATQLNAQSNVAGTFTYLPPAGTVLNPGTTTLLATFVPADPSHYTPGSVTTTINVTPSLIAASVNWLPPLAITAGTSLSSAQLNATSSVPGTFAYLPGAGTQLPVGLSRLSVFFTPADTSTYSTANASVPITVLPPLPVAPPITAAPLVILSPLSGVTLSGVVTVAGSCTLSLDAAGTFLMVDGQEVGTRRTFGPFLYLLDTSSLSNGQHSLQLWAHDIGNNTTTSQPILITVAN